MNKYELEQRRELWSQGYWDISDNLDLTDFDLSWRPDCYEPPYIHEFGTQWQPSGGPRFIIPEAQGIVYHEFQRAKALPDRSRWQIHTHLRVDFDFSWHPPRYWEPYNYIFGNQINPRYPTVSYNMKNATKDIYMDNILAKVSSDSKRWVSLHNVKEDFNNIDWVPPLYDPPYIYVWGNQYLASTEMPTVEYHVPGAIHKKYMMDRNFTLVGDPNNWAVYDKIDHSRFDFTWSPHPYDSPYIYVWGNRWVPGALKVTAEYRVPGATRRKYMTDDVVLLTSDNMKQLLPVDPNSFDLSWRPSPTEPPYIYVWGHRYAPTEIEAALEYHVPGATERKYMKQKVELLPDLTRWKKLVSNVVYDFSWRPDPREPAYIYVWGHKYAPIEVEVALEYHVPGATARKYMTEELSLAPDKTNWKILIDGADFDFGWRPDPREPAYIYVWGNKWNSAEVEPTVEYHVPGATERKYMNDQVAILPQSLEHWTVNDKQDLSRFDFSWRPNPYSPPQIYQWSDGGPIYTVPKSSNNNVVLVERTSDHWIKQISKYVLTTTIEDLVEQHPDEVFWALSSNIDYANFNFSWRPSSENFRHINVFGNKLSNDLQTYLVNAPLYRMGYREYNYIEDYELDQYQDLELAQNTIVDVFWIDRNNNKNTESLESVKLKLPNVISVRWVGSWLETIQRCIRKSATKYCWILSSELDYSEFDFNFYPAPWQTNMIHIFGTQYSHWGNTYYVNTKTILDKLRWVKTIEEATEINHVRRTRARAHDCLYDILYINFGNDLSDRIYQQITELVDNTVHMTYWSGSYLETIKNWIQSNPLIKTKNNYQVWVCASICNYDIFDFKWIADPYQRDQIHVWGSSYKNLDTKFGDTFLINITKLITELDNLELLENYKGQINYIGNNVPRLPHPVITHDHDVHIDAITETTWTFPYAQFVTKDDQDLMDTISIPQFWQNTPVHVQSLGATNVMIPKQVKEYITKEVYDYPYIITSKQQQTSKPMDIIFISNGEAQAEQNWEHLERVINHNNRWRNRLNRIDNVDGRVQAYHAAADASTTPWFFAVFAKLRVNPSFNWNWQPDRLQCAKHYIYTAVNPVNRLSYGHQAMIMYNVKLTLANPGIGLDFTLDSPHQTVELNSGIANYNTDPWSTWRTAFREAIKLKHTLSNEDSSSTHYRITKHRLERWMSTGSGQHSQWSQRGASDAVNYYEQVSGDIRKLKLSYEWAWLNEYWTQLGHSSKTLDDVTITV